MTIKTVHLDEIPYCPDSGELFERIRDLPRAALLDSSYPHTTAGRYDIITAQPWQTDLPRLPAGADEQRSHEFFQEIGRFHREYYAGTQPASQDIPFCGGILGYLGYDSGNADSPGVEQFQ